METSETKRKYKILPVIDTVHILIDDAILSRNDIDTVPENLGQCNGHNVVHAVWLSEIEKMLPILTTPCAIVISSSYLQWNLAANSGDNTVLHWQFCSQDSDIQLAARKNRRLTVWYTICTIVWISWHKWTVLLYHNCRILSRMRCF